MTDTTDIKALRDQPDHDPYALVMAQNEALTKGIVVLQSQLEAERQRADGGVKEHRVHAARLIDECGQLRERAEKAEAEIAALREKLAKPVVLKYRRNYGFTDPETVMLINAVTDRCAAAIKEAGYPVQGE